MRYLVVPVVALFILFGLMVFALVHSVNRIGTAPCSDFKDDTVGHMPVRCLKEYGVGK